MSLSARVRHGHTEAMSEQIGITVSATAVVTAPVDQVVIVFGMEIMRPDAAEAFRTAAGTVERVLGILADNEVDSRTVRTAELSFGPRTTWQADREVMLGYVASQQLVVTPADVGAVERILSAVIADGGAGVRINSVTQQATQPQEALVVAREDAVSQARVKAEHFARLTGRQLGRLTSLVEGGGQRPGMPGGARRMPLSASVTDTVMPVAAGDQDVSVSITASWSFAD